MFRIESKINPQSREFQENAAALKVQVEQFKQRLAEVKKGGRPPLTRSTSPGAN